jgi:two-component system response regulator NreC
VRRCRILDDAAITDISADVTWCIDRVMKVLIVDDQPLYRMGICDALAASGEFQITGSVSTAAAALALLEQDTPDVVLMDISLPEMDGIAATREINRRSPRPRVLIMSAHEETLDVLDALDAGATGYIGKAEGADGLVQALRATARGERYLGGVLAARVGQHRGARVDVADILSVLSPRERDVFHLAADCLTTREIATKLAISTKTVETHLQRVHQKLGVRSAAELVRLGANLRLRSRRRSDGGDPSQGVSSASRARLGPEPGAETDGPESAAHTPGDRRANPSA